MPVLLKFNYFQVNVKRKMKGHPRIGNPGTLVNMGTRDTGQRQTNHNHNIEN